MRFGDGRAKCLIETVHSTYVVSRLKRAMGDVDSWAILSDRELQLNLDFQFRQCFDRPLPDIEELIDVLSTVHTVLERLLRAEDVSRLLDHIAFCRQFEEISDLANTLLEPFKGIERYARYFEGEVCHSFHGPEPSSLVSHDEYCSGFTSAATTTGSLRHSDDSSFPHTALLDRGMRASGEGTGRSLDISYVPSWDAGDPQTEGGLGSEGSTLKSSTAKLSSRIASDHRALTADFVLASSAEMGDPSIVQQRLAATTGSLPSEAQRSFEDDHPILGATMTSLTPKAVGKYLPNGSRVHTFATSRRSLFAQRRRSNTNIDGNSPPDSFFFGEKYVDGSEEAAAGSSSSLKSDGGSLSEPKSDSTKDTFTYLNGEDLRPSANPSRDIAQVVQALPMQDWPEIFYTLNTLRSLARFHHDHIIASASLHTLVGSTIKLVDNLRSALAKNAMLALGDLFVFVLPAAMDLEVPRSIDCLMKVTNVPMLLL